jgi:hypothetical protein
MTRIAGARQAGLVVDYKDVLEQAVANERRRVLLAVRDVVEVVKDTVPGRYSWETSPRDGTKVKADILFNIKQLETL